MLLRRLTWGELRYALAQISLENLGVRNRCKIPRRNCGDINVSWRIRSEGLGLGPASSSGLRML
jgi:hypothetical protein